MSFKAFYILIRKLLLIVIAVEMNRGKNELMFWCIKNQEKNSKNNFEEIKKLLTRFFHKLVGERVRDSRREKDLPKTSKRRACPNMARRAYRYSSTGSLVLVAAAVELVRWRTCQRKDFPTAEDRRVHWSAVVAQRLDQQLRTSLQCCLKTREAMQGTGLCHSLASRSLTVEWDLEG